LDLNPIHIAVTGSNGFIGQEIMLWSNFPKQFDIRICDSIDQITELGSWGEGAVLLHLAGCFSGDHDVLWNSNVELTRKALEYFSKVGGNRVIFLSTGAVYGTSAHLEGSREDDLVKPANYYGFTKRLAEMVVEYDWGCNGYPYHILRLPNVYGERQRKGVIFQMRNRIQEQNSVLIEGNGEQRRDFLHISDLLAAIERVVEYPEAVGIFNISSHLSLTVNQLADQLTGGLNIRRDFGPDKNQLQELVLDINKAKQQLEYLPKVNNLYLGV